MCPCSKYASSTGLLASSSVGPHQPRSGKCGRNSALLLATPVAWLLGSSSVHIRGCVCHSDPHALRIAGALSSGHTGLDRHDWQQWIWIDCSCANSPLIFHIIPIPGPPQAKLFSNPRPAAGIVFLGPNCGKPMEIHEIHGNPWKSMEIPQGSCRRQAYFFGGIPACGV